MGIWGRFCFQYHLGLYIIQEFSYWGKVFLVSIWFGLVLSHIITWVCKDSLILRYSTTYQYLTNITILVPTWRFFETIIDVGIIHSPIYYSYIGKNQMPMLDWYHTYLYKVNAWNQHTMSIRTLKNPPYQNQNCFLPSSFWLR